MNGSRIGKKEYFPEDIKIRLSGRTLYANKSLYLLHAASYIEFLFVGQLLEMELDSEGGGEDFQAWIGVYINDMNHAYRRIPLKTGNRKYQIWESDSIEKVTVRIVKLSESQYAYTAVSKIIIDENALVVRTSQIKKRIEFIGDSITCGFGNEGNAGDEFTTGTENPLKAYGVLTAQKLDCDFTLVAWSGIGILSSWIPPEGEEPNTEVLAPNVYPYVDYGLFTRKSWIPNEKYNYKEDNCDVIVINLGTNDASYTRDNPERKQAFQIAYQKFLRELRVMHRNKPIVCTSNAMTSLLNQEIKTAVEIVRKMDYDELVFHMQFSDSNVEDGEGAVGHPSLLRHEKMAEQLSDWMKKKRILV